jgi:hypothetical protein
MHAPWGAAHGDECLGHAFASTDLRWNVTRALFYEALFCEEGWSPDARECLTWPWHAVHIYRGPGGTPIATSSSPDGSSICDRDPNPNFPTFGCASGDDYDPIERLSDEGLEGSSRRSEWPEDNDEEESGGPAIAVSVGMGLIVLLVASLVLAVLFLLKQLERRRGPAVSGSDPDKLPTVPEAGPAAAIAAFPGALPAAATANSPTVRPSATTFEYSTGVTSYSTEA